MATQVKVCKYDGDNRVIDKIPTLLKTLECRITDPLDVFTPTLILTNIDEVRNANYFVIGFRKYFKVKERLINNKMMEVVLREDVLSTWANRVNIKGAIKAASSYTSENVEQNYLLDENKLTSRLRIENNYGEIRSDPMIIITSPLYTQDRP